jgi:hypothetical protein
MVLLLPLAPSGLTAKAPRVPAACHRLERLPTAARMRFAARRP